MKKIIYLLTSMILFSQTFSQVLDERIIIDNNFENVKNIETPQNMKSIMKTGKDGNVLMVYDTINWRKLVDEAWGAGIPTEEKLKIFDHYWDTISTSYAAFNNLRPMNWDSAAKAYRDEIAAGVSKGRFQGIMTQLILKLNDGHTFFMDKDIYSYNLYPGLPRANFFGHRNFAGCLTTLPDTTVLVYSSVQNNVFELVAGDIILGYNNRKLSYLFNEVLDKQLPGLLAIGSTDEATWHQLLFRVAASWNLYDTIDVLKTDGTIKHYPTNLMVGMNYTSDCYEIIPPVGIIMPTYQQLASRTNHYAYGMIPGTNIGYVAMLNCMENSGDSLLNIFKYLCETKKTDGIVFDNRSNTGGSINAFHKALAYIYNEELINWFGCATRVNETDRLLLKQKYSSNAGYNLSQSDNYFYNKPIALLTGPNAFSAGDVLPIYFRNHLTLKIFGKPTAGAFGAMCKVDIGYSEVYNAYMQSGNFYLVADTGKYLSHSTLKIDFPVWLTAEGAANNRDDVIDAAVKWINSTTEVVRESKAEEFEIFPNPANDFIIITGVSGNIRIHDIMGREVLKGIISNDEKISVIDLTPGLYYIVSEGIARSQKFMIMR